MRLRTRIARALRAVANRLDPLPAQPEPIQWTYTINMPGAGWTCPNCGQWTSGVHACTAWPVGSTTTGVA